MLMSPSNDPADALVETMLGLDTLWTLPRTGWLLRGIQPCESIAEHSYGVAMVAMLLVDRLRQQGVALDGERVLRMALVHDAPEAALGDVPMPRKNPQLKQALTALEDDIAQELLPAEAVASWRESQAKETPESRLVKAADKIQMMIKVLAYERAGRGHLEQFWQNPDNFNDAGFDVARDVFDAICRRAGRRRPS